MKYHCENCNSDFDRVVEKLESVVNGELLRANNDLKNPCCPECLNNALNELRNVVMSLR